MSNYYRDYMRMYLNADEETRREAKEHWQRVDRQKMKRATIAALLVAILTACIHMNVYTVEVTATERTITGADTRGEAVTLTECLTEGGERLLLEGVEEGKHYSVRINGFGTWTKEDDEIIRVKETK